jgi:hypothetical protein
MGSPFDDVLSHPHEGHNVQPKQEGAAAALPWMRGLVAPSFFGGHDNTATEEEGATQGRLSHYQANPTGDMNGTKETGLGFEKRVL